jgi:hypothetical protein
MIIQELNFFLFFVEVSLILDVLLELNELLVLEKENYFKADAKLVTVKVLLLFRHLFLSYFNAFVHRIEQQFIQNQDVSIFIHLQKFDSL